MAGKRAGGLWTGLMSSLRIPAFLAAAMAATGVSAQVSFTEVGAQAGIGDDIYVTTTAHGLGVNWIDYDKDGWPDLFLVNGFDGGGAHLFRNEGNGTFSRQDALLPPLPNVEMMGSVFADFDNDGDSDIYIFTDNETGPVGPSAGPVNILLKNLWVENGRQVLPGQPLFAVVTMAAGVEDLLDEPHADGPAYRSAGGGWLDYDRDGHVDLYICHWDRQKHGEASNKDRFYRNLGDGTFADVTDTIGIVPVDDGTYNRPCLAFMAAHLDDDLWPDMYVGNVDAPLPWSRDIIFQNNAGTGFTDRTLDSAGVGDDADAAMGVTTGDIDLNGGWDLYLSDLSGGVEPTGNPLYLHTGTDILFNDNSADVAGVRATGSWGVNFLDVDHDGYEDLFVATMSETRANILFLNNGDGTFTELPGGLGTFMGRGSAYADYDRDGDLDIAVVGRDGAVQLHRNDSVNTGHWVQIQLHTNPQQSGQWSNRDGIGTLVKISAAGRNFMRQVIGGDSGHGQNSLDLHFGLGDASVIDVLEVFWPSGAVTTLLDQPVDTFIAVSEVGAAVALVAPQIGLPITETSTTFEWISPGALPTESWQLLVGTSAGASDLFDSGELAPSQLSVLVSGLPTDGTQVFARLQYGLNGVTYAIDYQWGSTDAPPPPPPPPPGTPGMSTPVPGSVLAGSSQTFEWTANGAAVEQWQLVIGTTPGGNQLLSQGLGAEVLSFTANGLPTDGSTVYVRLRWRIAGQVSLADYVYTAAGDGGPPPPPPESPGMSSPAPGSVLAGSSQTFEWTANGAAVTQWQLQIGTTPGGNQLLSRGLDADVLSFTATGLPTDGSTVYVRLRWRIAGQVTTVDYVYTAAGDGGPPPPPPESPGMSSPAPGSVLAGSSQTFEWTANGAAVERWQLQIGTAPGGTQLLSRGLDANVLSFTAAGLPTDGSTVYVRLRWRIAGQVYLADYEYTATTQ